jgi:hypothetical protein
MILPPKHRDEQLRTCLGLLPDPGFSDKHFSSLPETTTPYPTGESVIPAKVYANREVIAKLSLLLKVGNHEWAVDLC